MKILVLGGTRYFGRRFVHMLIDEGHEVWVLSRGNLKDDFGSKVHHLIADRSDKAALQKAVDGLSFDAVVDQVCMVPQQIEDAIEIFKGRISYYLMTSTVSVYDFGPDLKEDLVVPANYKPRETKTAGEAYGEGKRAAEYALLKAPFKFSMARFPVVLGEDDYTRRLHEQIEKVQDGKPIYYPNLEARFSFITADDAAKSLLWLLKNHKTGEYNFSAADHIKLGDLMKMIEKAAGKKANLLSEPSEKDWSPYGIPSDWYPNVDKAHREGFTARPLAEWLEPLIQKIAASRS